MSDNNTLTAPGRANSLEVDLKSATLPTHAVRNDFVDADMPRHLRETPQGAGHEIAMIHFSAVRDAARAFVAASGAPAAALKAIEAPSQREELAFAA